ncbi:MAG: hypothetical protein J7453_12340, partial [Thermomicrobium sp.]|nr:hypothetical protein [Thermomicrobium sp.]
PTPTPTPAGPTPTPTPTGTSLTLGATHTTFLFNADPDGSGDLGNNQFRISATVIIGGSPAANKWVRFTLTPSTGDTVAPAGPFTVQTTSSGVATIGPITFNDGGAAGGTVFVYACVDQDLDGTCDGSPTPATTTLYFLRQPATPLSSVITTGCASGTLIIDECVPGGSAGTPPTGQPAGKDVTLTLTLNGPASAGPKLPVIAVITDAFPPSGTTANASFTTCTTPASDGTDVQARLTSYDGTNHVATWDIFVCGIVNDTNYDTFSVAVYWDVDGNGAYTAGVDFQIGSTLTFTIEDNN